VQDRKVRIKYINTANNLADVLTKLVGKDALQRAQQGLGLKAQQVAVAQQSPALPLREAVEGDATKQGFRPDENFCSSPAHAQITKTLEHPDSSLLSWA
jgi:hypothetical protein